VIFCEGLRSPEAPVRLSDRSWLVVEMAADRGCVTHVSADGRTKRVVAKTGRPNGLAVDRRGVIWVAESRPPSLLRLTMDGTVEMVASECAGEPFLWPNDLCFGPDGALYMTDSGIRFEDLVPHTTVRPDFMDMSMDGRVYQIDVSIPAVRKLDSGIRFTNGIAFGPDRRLYVAETVTGIVYRYQSMEDGRARNRELFGNVFDSRAPEGFTGPDGMAFDAAGNLYVTVFGQGDVSVLGTDGRVIGRIMTSGRKPTNVAFGPPGERQIYVTEVEHGRIEIFGVAADGLALYT
jgi:gluconolactonase